MSQENARAVRQAVAVRAQTRRHLEETLALRFPRIVALAVRAALRLPPRTRLRQALIRRSVRLGLEATNRRDYDATFILYHPDCESIFPAGLVSFGEVGTRGLDERIRWQRAWYADWGEFQFEPEELIDLGDRHLVIGHMRGSGLSSGAAVDSEWAILWTSSGGLVTREQLFMDQGEALEAVGLSE